MIKIGEVIQNLRKNKGLTQEQIADVFGVSIAAVSKWETGVAYPDITLLPTIAKFFNVSVDYLLDYKMTSYDQIEDITKKAEQLFAQGKKLEALQLLTESIIKYPNDIKLKFSLGRFKTFVGSNLKGESKVKMLEEAIELFNEIIQLTHERPLVDESYHLMSDCYLFLGKGEQALEIIGKIRTSKRVHPEAIVSNILYMMGRTNEGNQKSQENLYQSLTDILANLSHFIWNNKENPSLCLDFLELKEKIITAFNKEQDSYLSLELSYCFESKAWNYCKMNNIEMTLHYLMRSITITTIVDSNPDILKNKPYFNLIEIDALSKPFNFKQRLKNVIFCDDRKEYKNIMDLDEFKQLIKRLDI